jgi:hypothetical protein
VSGQAEQEQSRQAAAAEGTQAKMASSAAAAAGDAAGGGAGGGGSRQRIGQGEQQVASYRFGQLACQSKSLQTVAACTMQMSVITITSTRLLWGLLSVQVGLEVQALNACVPILYHVVQSSVDWSVLLRYDS